MIIRGTFTNVPFLNSHLGHDSFFYFYSRDDLVMSHTLQPHATDTHTHTLDGCSTVDSPLFLCPNAALQADQPTLGK